MAKINEDELLDKINKLDRELTALRDEYVKYRRQQEDLMYNLDDDNLSTVYKQGMDGRFTKIEVDADGIRTEVQAVGDNLEVYRTETEETAEKISMQLSTFFTNVVKVDDNPLEDPAAVSQYKGQLITYEAPPNSGNYKNYYFNTLAGSEGEWEEIDSNSVSSLFVQTADGIYIKGTVKIQGNTFLDGKTVQNGTFISKSEEGLIAVIENGALIITTDPDNPNATLLRIGYYDITQSALSLYVRSGWKLYGDGDIRIPARFG